MLILLLATLVRTSLAGPLYFGKNSIDLGVGEAIPALRPITESFTQLSDNQARVVTARLYPRQGGFYGEMLQISDRAGVFAPFLLTELRLAWHSNGEGTDDSISILDHVGWAVNDLGWAHLAADPFLRALIQKFARVNHPWLVLRARGTAGDIFETTYAMPSSEQLHELTRAVSLFHRCAAALSGS